MRDTQALVDATGNDTDYGAALCILLGNPSLREKLGQHVGIDQFRGRASEQVRPTIHWDAIMAAAEPMSHGECILVDLAFHLFSGSVSWWMDETTQRRLEAMPCDWLAKLDDDNLRLVLRALEVKRGWLPLAEALNPSLWVARREESLRYAYRTGRLS